MIRRCFLVFCLLYALIGHAGEKEQNVKLPEVTQVNLAATLGDASSFTLTAELETFGPAKIKLIGGDVCITSPLQASVSIAGDSGSFWTKNPEAMVVYKDKSYFLDCPAKGKYTVKLDFVSKIGKDALLRNTSFYLMSGLIRKVSLQLSPDDIEPEIKDCMALAKNGMTYSGTLQTSGDFFLSWKRLVDNKAAVLAVNAELYSVGSVLAGAVKLNTVIVYRIFQGSLEKLQLRVPKGLNVLAVKGKNIRDWQVDKNNPQQIIVDLNEKQNKDYSLEIQAEQILAEMPCTFALSPIVPENVMRLDGVLRFGAGRGVKLLVDNTPGLVQVDNSSFNTTLLPKHEFALLNPLSYNFSGGDYQLKAKVENISPSYTADVNCVAVCGDRALQVRLDYTLDIKDAPLRDITLHYEPELTFSRVIGRDINPQDYDLFAGKSGKSVKIAFRQPVDGKVSFSVYLERELKNDDAFRLADFNLEGAKSVRGYLLLAVERGLKLLPENLKNLTPVHPGSLPIRQERLQYAYLFRNQDWGGNVKISHVKGNIISEVFNLISVGEGTAYGSSVLSFHISGAPVDTLRFIVGDNMKNLEFKGADIISRKKIGQGPTGFSIWEVTLRKKQLGDLTLLATYEMSIKDGGTLRLGAISAADADFSSSFIALAGVKSLKVSSSTAAPNVREIDQSELPVEYLRMINNPLLKVYRGNGKEQWQDVQISRYEKCGMPQTVIDRTELSTRLDGNGGSVTTVQYRVKNSTGQFLSLKLPENSDLWNVSVDGQPKRLSVSDGALLIPLPRHRNINLPIAITVTYARQFKSIDDITKITLEAPGSNIKSLFCEWQVTVPENCAIVSSDPVPVNRKDAFRGGFAGLMERFVTYSTSIPGVIFYAGWLIATLIGMLFVWGWAKKYKVIMLLTFLAGGVVTLVTSLALLFRVDSVMAAPVHSFIVNQATFSRVMGLAGNEFAVNLVIKNMEAATMRSVIYSLGSLLVAVAGFIVAVRLGNRLLKALCCGIACSLIVFAASQWFLFSVYGALILLVLIPLLFSLAVWTVVWRKARTAVVVALMGGILLTAAPGRAEKAASPQEHDGITIESLTCYGSVTKPLDKALAPGKIKADKLPLFPVADAVRASYNYVIKADKPGQIELLGAPAVVTNIHNQSSNVKIFSKDGKYIAEIKEKGQYRLEINFETPITRSNGKLTFALLVPQCITNSFTLSEMPSPWYSFGVMPAGIQKTKSRIKALNAVTMQQEPYSTKACFTPGTTALFEISEKAPEMKDGSVTCFAKTVSYVQIGRGSAEIRNVISLNIPQGSLSILDLTIPENMRVTSVLADNLDAWRFDQKSKVLKVFFSKPQSDNCEITVNSQIPGGKLPRSISIAPLKLDKANKQYGSLGIFVNQDVKVTETANKNFTPINNEFFRVAETNAAPPKKTFRYSGPDALLTMEVSEVKPELRVIEKSQVDFEDERVTLNSELMLNIIKGGIFSVRLQLPAGFEINSLNGPHIQHWDEINVDGGVQLVINFDRRLSGKNTFKLILSKMVSENYRQADIPAIRVINACKHTGTLRINVEKGTTVSILNRSGVTVATQETGFNDNGSDFKILRPDWKLKVAFAVTPPWIQASTLQNITIKTDTAECMTYFNYSIENAGVKRFRITLPDNCAAPEFSGRYIRSAGKLEGNTWSVELDRKVERSYSLRVRSQLKLNKDNTLSILPFVSPDSGVQTGYITVFAEDSLQLKTISMKGELSVFNSRNIPAIFGAKNLSDAILCFRSVGKNCSAEIKIIRHSIAAVLKATVDSVAIKSLIAKSGEVLSKATLTVNNNNETFLPVRLPEGATLWAAFIDSSPVEAVKSGELSLIPLKQDTVTGVCKQTVEFIYSITAGAKWTPEKQAYKGPLFGLPLKNIHWEIFLPEDREYSDFDGTLKYRDELLSALAVSSIQDYDIAVKARVESEAGEAQKLFSLGRSYIKSGYNKKAFEAFNKANAFTGNKALQSDIQGQQLLNSRLQNVSSLSQRRSMIAQSAEAQTQQKSMQQEQTNNMQALRQQMGDEELKNLQIISDKIFMQQQAAVSTPRIFDILIPWKGRKITFERALEIRKDAPLEINFKSGEKLKLANFSAPLLFGVLALIFTAAFALMMKKDKDSGSVAAKE